MSGFLKRLLPIIISFFLGIILRRIRIFSKKDGERFLRLVFYISLPALILESFFTLELTIDFIFLPIIATSVFFLVFSISFLLGKFLKLPRKTFGTFLLASMIMNTGFSLPFFQAAWGKEGVIRITMFDLGNNLLIFTFAFLVAMHFGDSKQNNEVSLKKFFHLPPVWAVLLGLVINVMNLKVPVFVINTFAIIGKPTMLLLMISLGLFFTPKINKFKYVMIAIFLRMGVGFAIGYLFSLMIPLDEVSRKIVIISSGAPVGYNTLIFSNMENLDTEYAASVVSISILFGIFYLPFLIYVL